MTDHTANWHVSRHGVRDNHDQTSNVRCGDYHWLANTASAYSPRHGLSDRYDDIFVLICIAKVRVVFKRGQSSGVQFGAILRCDQRKQGYMYVGGLALVELRCALVLGASFFAWMQTCLAFSSMEMECGQREVWDFHVRQHSHVIPSSVAYGGVLRLRLQSLFLGIYSRGTVRVGFELFFYRRRAAICSFLQSTNQGGRCYRAMECYVRTALVFF